MSRYGLLDLPGVVFGWINAPLTAVLPEPLVLALWALVSAWMTMAVYRHFSNQEKLAALKPEIKAVQKQLSNYDGDFGGLMPLIRENFRLSGRHILLALGPALAAGIPVLFVLVWVSNAFGVHFPEPGKPVEVRVITDTTTAQWQWYGTAAQRRDTAAPDTAWHIRWPAPDAAAELVDGNDTRVVTLPPARPSPVLHKRQWWNMLIANPAGYLAPENPADAIYLDLPERQMLPFGPDWMRGWEFLYFVLLIIGSLGLKSIWKIH